MSDTVVQLQLDERPERILVIAPSTEATEQIGKILRSRGFEYKHAKDIPAAIELAVSDLFDLVIAEQPNSAVGVLEIATGLSAAKSLRQTPIIISHPDALKTPEDQLSGLPARVQLLPYPWERSMLLVKAAAELRVRKLRTEEARFMSGISGQNLELRDLTNRFMRELREAQAIQTSLMPTELPSAPNTRFAAAYVPLDVVGGDIYDIWNISKDVHGLFIGDVTGHGLSAALIGAMTKMAISYAPKESPDEMLREMNHGLTKLMPDGRFVTAEAAFYNSVTGTLLFARGGHPPALIWRAESQTVDELAPRGFALGMLEGSRYELIATTLKPGDKLLMVTDGMTETADMNGRILGVSGVSDFFGRLAAAKPIGECIGELLDLREEYSRGRTEKDDIAVIGLERVA